jgi:hypothetical protein
VTYLACPECGHRHELKMVDGHECVVLNNRPILLSSILRFECRGPRKKHHNCPPDHPFFDIEQYKRVK